MDTLPRLDKKIVTVTALDDITEEQQYWLSRGKKERLEAIEIQRRLVYGKDRIASGLQRFFEVSELI